ncbi:fas apoptotic inhibitory molecule 1 isoform X2 [Anopheles aquasalis]|uniref:fas apoptotic inhibitory molecule 1 isoform X2 n=1 Tax=Anopheles aquasalis TaxID=42839 RepID=UPI00215AAB5D|nr:fas apoptotic inhibitory molecule 1 isoform X2 [Anopheles aquasalis]
MLNSAEILSTIPSLGGKDASNNHHQNGHQPHREVVARWRVPMYGKVYEIEFEHGTASGKRVLWIDKQEVFRRDWMFKLVGEDMFKLEDKRCIIRVDPLPGFRYSYSLFVDGKSFEQFTECQAKALKTWETKLGDNCYRIVLEKNTLNIYVNGKLIEENGEFVDGGTDTTFIEDNNTFVLSARTSGNKREGIVHRLTVNGTEILDAGTLN